MFHFNCENDDFPGLARHLDHISQEYGDVLAKLEWVSLGGGIFFTKKGYPVAEFCAKLKAFARTHGVQVYLEPGEAAITQSAELVATVLDVVHNEVDTAILDVATEAHMPDLLLYSMTPRIASPGPGAARDHHCRPHLPGRATSSAATASRPASSPAARSASRTWPATPWSRRTGSTGFPCRPSACGGLTGRWKRSRPSATRIFKDSLS
jgi:hypothetical protein